MIEQRRFALDALRAVVRELDNRLSEDTDPTPKEHDHHVWLVTAAAILADVAVEWRDSRPEPTPEAAKADPEAMAQVVERRKEGVES